MRKVFHIVVCFILLTNTSSAQQIPSVEENIPYLVTFGKSGSLSWGDDDFPKLSFFVIPQFRIDPVYIRVYDPEISGDNDEKRTEYNTQTRFSVYGGKTCFTNKDAQTNQPVGNYKSGNLLRSKVFGMDEKYNNEWYTFGPFNPTEGEYVNAYGGYVFKVIAEGISGDDGNLYRYFLSSSPTENKAIEGGNEFTFEYTFRLSDDLNSTAHLYPYIEENVAYIKISNFDFDNDGDINIVSIAKKEELSKPSGDCVWATTHHKVTAEEKKTVLDVQFIKNKKTSVKNNNVTLFVMNQYGDLLPVFTVPIGGISPPSYKIDFREKSKTTRY